MGWDAFGLPAENYAIKTKTHPAIVVRKNIARFKKQLQSLGFSYDWRREINTTDPSYYKWTQWIFLQLFRRGLASHTEAPINWCPSCKTGLANEEVAAGECERCGAKVEKKLLPQWVLKITAYADRLLNDLETLDWPEHVKEMQRNWIGRSEGYEVTFKVVGQKRRVSVFTTRIDTIFGATFLALAPEHPLAGEIASASERRKVEVYRQEALNRSDLDRQADTRLKTGVFTGAYAINPATREKIPIWVSDYVLAGYGTGAIMGVPAHDARDFDFAHTFHLPVREVVSADGNRHDDITDVYEGEGILVNSGPFDRMRSREAMEKIAAYVAARPAVRYKLRDWIFSRQRYWGEPIPLVFCERCKKLVENSKFKSQHSPFSAGELLNPGWIPLPEKDLPLKLPNVESYEPTGTGESPLAAMTDWVNTKCPRCGGPAKRETNTMPQWAGSCWYYLAYCVRKNSTFDLRNSKLLKYWLPVDLYVGGVEHAVLHLLYARFWHKFLYDIGVVPTKEPFQKLFNQGLILGPDGEKMSKSRGNVINPDDMVKTYGADSLRLYEMFMGPLEVSKPWDPQGIVGMYRFLNRVWDLAIEPSKRNTQKTKISPNARLSAAKDIKRVMHKTIKKVTDDIAALRFNTAISALMEFQNALAFQLHLLSMRDRNAALDTLISLLAPFAPHLTEELWHIRRKGASVHDTPWPKYDPRWLKEETVTYIIQVNGKLRDTVSAKPGAAEAEVLRLAKKRPKVSKWLSGKPIKRTVFVKDKLVNFVI
jgi:leucyl-tRNA synthetase